MKRFLNLQNYYKNDVKVIALNAFTGEHIWTYFHDEIYQSLLILSPKGDIIYVTTPKGTIIALDAYTGKVKWETQI